MSFLFPKVELPPQPQAWSSWHDPDPLTVDERAEFERGYEFGRAEVERETIPEAGVVLIVALCLALGVMLGRRSR